MQDSPATNRGRRVSAKAFIIGMILLVLVGKLFFYNSSPTELVFYYGISVTLVLFIVFFHSLFLYKDPYEVAVKKGAGQPPKNSLVSCMVAVKDEEEHIHRCIDSMLAQTYPYKEVIVVDDASTDATLKILREYEARCQITLIHLDQNVGKKRALSAAMAVAKGSIFAFTDSDSTWAPDAIEHIVKIFEYDPEVGAVSGHTRVLNADDSIYTRIQDTWYEGQYSIRKAFESIYGCVTCVSGPIAVFRRDAIYNFIPAWENDTFLGQEFRFATDRTLTGYVLGSNTVGAKLKRQFHDSPFVTSQDYPTKNWKINYSKSARAWTIVPNTFKKMIRQQVRWKKSFIRNLFFTGAFYWKKPFLPALFYYLHVIFVIFGPFVAFRHLVYLPLRGTPMSGIVYLAGIIFVGFMFSLAFRLEDRNNPKWKYRPLMSLLSTLVFSWLILYSLVTIRRMVWFRG